MEGECSAVAHLWAVEALVGPGSPIECGSWGVTGGLECVCTAWVPDGCGA